jgi:hypothetical protein
VWVRTFPPEASQGWTISFIERKSRYWLEASAGLKEAQLFEQGVQRAWQWAQPSAWIRWFTDGERRYGKELWKLASVYLPSSLTSDRLSLPQGVAGGSRGGHQDQRLSRTAPSRVAQR